MFRAWFKVALVIILFNESLSNESLKKGLESARGLYLDPLKSYNSKIVLVTAANYGYLNHLNNFWCFTTDRLGLKFLTISLDDKLYQHLLKDPRMISAYIPDKNVTLKSTNFRSDEFNVVTKAKQIAVLHILKYGYSIFFSDVDVVLTQDPVSIT